MRLPPPLKAGIKFAQCDWLDLDSEITASFGLVGPLYNIRRSGMVKVVHYAVAIAPCAERQIRSKLEPFGSFSTT